MTDNNSHLVCLACILAFLGALYIFYPALVAAAAPVIRSDEVSMVLSGGGGGASLNTTTTFNEQQNDTQQQESSSSSSSSYVLLSLVIPAYNEELRLEIMLQEAYDYLTQKEECLAITRLLQAASGRCEAVVEFILVNDGCSDQTERVYKNFCKAKSDNNNTNSRIKTIFRLLRLRRNAGKGAAVQTGMLAARGAFSLMVDADGATAFGLGLEAVAAYAASHDFILGSRADNLELLSQDGYQQHQQQPVPKANRSPLRKILQSGFHLLVVLLVGTSEIQDTQCGFKLFRGSVVRLLFSRLHLRRWAFDTELLYRAAGVHLRLQEVSVPWHEVEGSHLNTGFFSLARVATGMLRDMLCVRLCYTLRIWKLPQRPPGEETNKDR